MRCKRPFLLRGTAPRFRCGTTQLTACATGILTSERQLQSQRPWGQAALATDLILTTRPALTTAARSTVARSTATCWRALLRRKCRPAMSIPAGNVAPPRTGRRSDCVARMVAADADHRLDRIGRSESAPGRGQLPRRAHVSGNVDQIRGLETAGPRPHEGAFLPRALLTMNARPSAVMLASLSAMSPVTAGRPPSLRSVSHDRISPGPVGSDDGHRWETRAQAVRVH
jgi:hypothetical protein